MPMRRYSSADAGASLLTDVNGGLITLLTTVLVGTSGVAYGSKPSAGWTKPFTGTNLAAFKQGTGGHDRYLRVSDGGRVGTDVRRALLRGYEAMTAISTGTGPYPTTTQINGDGQFMPYIRNGVSTTCPWIMYANSNTFYLFVNTGNSSPGQWEFCGFGTGVSRKSGDTYMDFIWAGTSLTGGTSCGMQLNSLNEMFMARSDTGVLGAKPAALYSDAIQVAPWTYLGVGSSSAFPYPDRVTSGLLMSRPLIYCDGYLRGKIPGIWESMHTGDSIGVDGTTFSGAGANSSRTFEMFRSLAPQYYGVANPIIETSDTWDT